MTERQIDTMNKFMVGLQGDQVVLLRPPGPRLTPGEAMILAAYLVAIAEHKAPYPFQMVLDAVVNT